METKEFHLGDILSVTTGHLVSIRHMDGVYDILNFMTGESLFTHQLPRASLVCRPNLLEQFPQLASVCAAGVTSKNWEKWLNEQVEKLGETLEVKPLSTGNYLAQDPLEELTEMVGPEKIIVVSTELDK